MAGIAALLTAGSPALAEWRALDDAEIEAALTDRRVIYVDDLGWQLFAGTGRTVVRLSEAPFGATSVGEWTVLQGRYCQRWTRVAEWACFTVEIDGTGGVRFIDRLGNVSSGHVAPE